jgi:hypothetical protein
VGGGEHNEILESVRNDLRLVGCLIKILVQLRESSVLAV